MGNSYRRLVVAALATIFASQLKRAKSWIGMWFYDPEKDPFVEMIRQAFRERGPEDEWARQMEDHVFGPAGDD